MRTLAIDPGVRALGWAFWHKPASGNMLLPAASGVLRSGSGELVEMWDEFDRLTIPRPEWLVIESQEVWQSAKSQAAATRGDLTKLAHLTGGIMHRYYADALKIQVVKPSEWKGQLDSRLLRMRLKGMLNEDYREHEADAVGLGLWAMGRF